MKTFSVFYSEIAASDLESIYSYIADELKNPTAAENLLRRLTRAIDDLNFMADSYHLYQSEPFYTQGVRYFSEGNYCVFYKIIDDAAHVIRIIYGARDLDKALME